MDVKRIEKRQGSRSRRNGQLALLILRVSMMSFVITLAGVGIWHTTTGASGVRWPWWYTVLSALLPISAVLGWDRTERPLEFRWLLGLASVMQFMMYAVVVGQDRRFFLGLGLVSTSFLLAVLMRPWRPGSPEVSDRGDIEEAAMHGSSFPLFMDVDPQVWQFAPGPDREGFDDLSVSEWLPGALEAVFPEGADPHLSSAMERAFRVLADRRTPDPETGWLAKLLWVRHRESCPLMVLMHLWPQLPGDLESGVREIWQRESGRPLELEEFRTQLGPGLRFACIEDEERSEVLVTAVYMWRPEWPDPRDRGDIVVQVTATPTEIVAIAEDLERLVAGLRFTTLEELDSVD